jgi:phosphoribosylformylglycinamidine synthase
MTIAFKSEGEAILLIGATRGWLGQSAYLRDLCGREEGAPPPVDLAAERRHGDFVRGLVRDRLITAAHDVSDGGLLVALAEMAIASGIGAILEPPPDIVAHAFWFGEDQARYVITTKQSQPVLDRAKTAGVPLIPLGATGGTVLAVAEERPLRIDDLKRRFEAWLPAYMAGAG